MVEKDNEITKLMHKVFSNFPSKIKRNERIRIRHDFITEKSFERER